MDSGQKMLSQLRVGVKGLVEESATAQAVKTSRQTSNLNSVQARRGKPASSKLSVAGGGSRHLLPTLLEADASS